MSDFEVVPTRCTFEVRPTKTTMQARFKGTIRKFKNKLTASQRERRRLQAIIRRRDRHIARLTAERDELQKRLSPTKVANHHYPAQMIALAVFIVVHANGSLRCAAKTAAFYAKLMGWDFGQPSHATIDNWARRLGLYALGHLGRKTGKYAAIIDESIQIGREKCLLLLGVRLPEEHSHFAPLKLSDVEVLGVEVQNSWKADDVAEFVSGCLEQHPDIDLQYMVSDQGNNLLGAFTMLGLHAVADCTHVFMNALKKLLADHIPLREMTAFMGTYRRQNTLSERSYLCPPTLRDKDRFLRIFVILDWVERLDACWTQLPPAHRHTLEYVRTQAVRELLDTLWQLRRIVSMATSILKKSGINHQSHQAWMSRLAQYRGQATLCPMAEQLIETVKRYFDDHGWLLGQHDRLLCCSDIIETTFGHYKNKGGMKVISSDVLYLPLLAHPIEVGLVKAGLATVSQKMVDQWHNQHTCDNRYSILRQLRTRAKPATAVA